MSIQEYLEKNRYVHNIILNLIENEFDSNEDYEKLCTYLNKLILHDDKYELISFLHLLSAIATNHHSGLKFIVKFEQILKKLSNIITKNISNSEIFNIFQDNKRILLFLFEEKILIMDRSIIIRIINDKYQYENYLQYFLPEIKSLKQENWLLQYVSEYELNKELPDNFDELRKEGQNDSYICKLIRNDSVEEFIQYVNRNNYSLQSPIPNSIYETNSFLIEKINLYNTEYPENFSYSDISKYSYIIRLIDYAAFFGSFEIFKYLQLNSVEFNPHLWIFTIHGKNAELIHILEEYESGDDKFKRKCHSYYDVYYECIKESIKCHHNDIANYFLDKYFSNRDIYSLLWKNLKFYNFLFLPKELNNDFLISYVCKYDYCSLLTILLNDQNIDINKILLNNLNIIQYIHFNNILIH